MYVRRLLLCAGETILMVVVAVAQTDPTTGCLAAESSLNRRGAGTITGEFPSPRPADHVETYVFRRGLPRFPPPATPSEGLVEGADEPADGFEKIRDGVAIAGHVDDNYVHAAQKHGRK